MPQHTNISLPSSLSSSSPFSQCQCVLYAVAPSSVRFLDRTVSWSYRWPHPTPGVSPSFYSLHFCGQTMMRIDDGISITLPNIQRQGLGLMDFGAFHSLVRRWYRIAQSRHQIGSIFFDVLVILNVHIVPITSLTSVLMALLSCQISPLAWLESDVTIIQQCYIYIYIYIYIHIYISIYSTSSRCITQHFE